MPLSSPLPLNLFSELAAATLIPKTAASANAVSAVSGDGVNTFLVDNAGGVFKSTDRENVFTNTANLGANVATAADWIQYTANVIRHYLLKGTQILMDTGAGTFATLQFDAGAGQLRAIAQGSRRHGRALAGDLTTLENSTMIAVNSNGEIYRSADRGNTWTKVRNLSASTSIQGVAFNGTTWVAPFYSVNTDQVFMLISNDDGLTWTVGNKSLGPIARTPKIAVIGNLFVISYQDTGNAVGALFVTPDGAFQSAAQVPPLANSAPGVASNNNDLLLVRDGQNIFVTFDGLIYRRQGPQAFNSNGTPVVLAYLGDGVNSGRWFHGENNGSIAVSADSMGRRVTF